MIVEFKPGRSYYVVKSLSVQPAVLRSSSRR